MKRLSMPAVFAGALTLGLAALPALADEPNSEPAVDKSAPAAAPEKSGPKEGVPKEGGPKEDQPAPSPAPDTRPDGRDQKIEQQQKQLEEQQKLIQELLKRVEDLEKRAPKDPETPDEPTPPVTPPVPPQLPGRSPRGGATLLPNISVVGNTIFRAGDTKGVGNRGRFTFDELEVAFQDQVAPKLRYDVFIAAGEEEDWNVELEEGFLTATGIFPGVNARVGRIRTPIGKFNPLHPHQWVFITRPSAHHALLGDHGLITDGAVLDWVLPTKGFYSNLQFGAWRNTTAGHHAHEEEEGGHEGEDDHDHEEAINPFDEAGFQGGDNFLYSGRFLLGKALSRTQELEFGLSRVWGRGEVEGFGRRMQAVNGLDLTYRSYPAAFKRIMLQAELLAHETQGIGGGTEYRPGAYAMAAYRWNRYWEAGARFDYTKFPYPVDGTLYGGSLFLTKYLTEQTSLRLEYRHEKHPLYGHGNGLFFQVLFGSGPHVHPLQ